MQECPEELAGLTLGPLLGRGAHGKVYRGQWEGRKVAVKVRAGGGGGGIVRSLAVHTVWLAT